MLIYAVMAICLGTSNNDAPNHVGADTLDYAIETNVLNVRPNGVSLSNTVIGTELDLTHQYATCLFFFFFFFPSYLAVM